MEVYPVGNRLDSRIIYYYSSIYIYGNLLSITLDKRIINGRDNLFWIRFTSILSSNIYERSSFIFEQADSLFLISYPAHMQKLIQYGMTYTFIRIAITNVVVVVAMLPVLMKSIGVTKIQVVLFWLFFTLFRCMLSLLTRYIHVCVGKGWLLWIIKNVIFSISLSFWE